MSHDAATLSRRRFLGATATSLAAAAASVSLRGQQEAPLLLPPYVTDIDGSGSINEIDQEIVSTALYAHRGFGLTPRPGFDYRADVLGRAAIDPLVVDAVSHSVQQYAESREPPLPRPITVAWHYGWYNTMDRPPGTQTVRFKGGNYRSFDPEAEATFNELKNEFGITVDALSWIPRHANNNNNTNYYKGYLRASNAETRHACLLYESTLALPSWGERISFYSDEVKERLNVDFREMARFLARVRDRSPARIFTLDARPVMFIFGTHTWGSLPLNATEIAAMDASIGGAIEEFADVYGTPPYLVGEEMQLSATGSFSDDRRIRTGFFDGIYIYHHASNLKRGTEQRLRMSPAYIQNQITILRKTYADSNYLRSRFTGRRLLVIPNLAPGFAKPGHPTIEIERGGYADFMKLVKKVHMDGHIMQQWPADLGQAALPAPVYVVGSWNEEFEGHCLFPFEFNLSVPNVEQHGFDAAMALKEVFGWNHYAFRDIVAAEANPVSEP